MGAQAEVVVDGVRFGEGPVWCTDGTLVVTSVADGVLYRVWPEQHRFELLADTGGGANGAALAADGSILVTQNGGIDFAATGLFDDPPSPRQATPGLQLARPDGTVTYLTDDGLNAPNDLCVAADGTVYFTDPGHYPPEEPAIGRVLAYERDGSVREIGRDFWFCNGIALDPAGALVVVERQGLCRLDPGGSQEWIIEALGRGAGDGFCIDTEGNFYVASTIEHGIRVVDAGGTIVDFLSIPGEGLTTNCCFGGPDNQWLFATDALPGTVVVWTDMPVAGLPLHTWPGPA